MRDHADHFKDDPGSKVQKRANPALKREPTITLMSVSWLSFSIPFYHHLVLVIPRSIVYEMGRLNRTKMLVQFCVFHLFMFADTQIAS